MEEKKPEKDLFGDWDIRRETTVRETTSSTEADSPFAQSNFVEAPVEPKQTENDGLDTPPFFRKKQKLMSIIKQNVNRIMNLVASSCNQVHRLSTEVCPIVVTKNRTAREVQEMYDLDFDIFAENRVEKLLERQEQFPQEDIIWHLIGPPKKRKVKQVINRIDLFHAIDRLSIMDEIENVSSTH